MILALRCLNEILITKNHRTEYKPKIKLKLSKVVENDASAKVPPNLSSTSCDVDL